MKKDELEKIIYLSLNKDLSVEEKSIITALVVNDFLSGKIMRSKCNNNYFNRVNNEVIDILNQKINYSNSMEIFREDLLLNEKLKNKYRIFLENMRRNFIKYGSREYTLVNGKNQKIKSKIPGTFGGHKKLKIYGKMDCPSALKWIEKGHYVKERVFFLDEETAIEAGYRPCSVCMKREYKKWKNNLI